VLPNPGLSLSFQHLPPSHPDLICVLSQPSTHLLCAYSVEK
jgi:hypothetical protein